MLSRRTAQRALTVARHECGTLMRSKLFVLGAILPIVAVVVIMWLVAHEVRADQRAVARAVEDAGRRAPVAKDATAEERGQGELEAAISGGMAFVFMYLMFIGIMATGGQLLSSLIEERSSRVIEVLLSAVNPLELMAGKILGAGAAGLAVMAVCGATVLGAAHSLGLMGRLRLVGLFWFAVFYVLGYLLAASVFTAVGSVCNNTREAQSLLMPLVLPFVIPLFCWMSIAQHPRGLLAVVLSRFPPTASMVTVMRMAADPTLGLWQILPSVVILGASVPLTIWAAAKVFHTGILMYGKPPRLRELLRWVRQA